MAADDPYKVGYRRPPKHTRFTPGRSGNPNGRPRGAKNVATVLDALLRAKIAVSENGRRRRISKLEVMLTQLVNKAVAGDLRSIQVLIGMADDIERKNDSAKDALSLSDSDREVLRSLYERIRRSISGEAS